MAVAVLVEVGVPEGVPVAVAVGVGVATKSFRVPSTISSLSLII